MRIVVFWADKGPEIASLLRTLEKGGHRVVYWLGYDGGEGDAPAGTIFHSHADADRGVTPRGVDTSDFLPPDEELISQLHRAESTLLTMMNRAFDTLTVDERRRKYYQMLRYWNGVFLRFRPEVAIFPVTPHAADDYLAYELARHLGIRTVSLYDTWVSDRMLCFEDFRESSPELSAALERNAGKNFSIGDLSPDLREYYEKNREKYYSAGSAYYLTEQIKKYSVMRRLRLEPNVRASILNGSVIWKAPRFLFRAMHARGFSARDVIAQCARPFRDTLKKEYARIAHEPDFSKKFIYVPLHSQPERATSPQGGIFADQLLMVEMLSASIPDGWEIFVKEHPIQWLRWGVDFSSSRYRGYYSMLARIPHVRVIPIETPARELVLRSETVATVTGMTGWEALLAGKPVIVFGYPWYRDCRGVFRVGTVAACRNAIRSIVGGGIPVREQDIMNYLKALDEATIHGYAEKIISRISKLSKQESMNTIARLLTAKLSVVRR